MPLPSRAQGFVPGFLNKTADVYADVDDFVAPVRAGLPCRLGNVDANGAASGNERARLLALRRLMWPASYVMPEGAQVAVDGDRWNTVRGTFAAPDGVRTANVYRSCDIARV